MLLLHLTPYSCIHGCSAIVTIQVAVTALVKDNPEFPLYKVAYLWMSPKDGLTGSRDRHIVWKGKMRDVHIGTHLSGLGFNIVEGNKRDNPSIVPV